MLKKEIERRIASFLVEHGEGKAEEFDPNAVIFIDGSINSFTILELSIFIEDNFAVECDEEHIYQLKSVGKIAERVVRATSINGEVA